MKERFREIYENYKGAIYGYLFYMTHDEHTAQDLSQETFLKNPSGIKKDERRFQFKSMVYDYSEKHLFVLCQKKRSRFCWGMN